MKDIINFLVAFLLAMAAVFSGCSNKDPNNEVDEPTDKELFCSCLNVTNIDQTIPVVDEFLSGLSDGLNDEQQLQELTAWLKSCSCIIDATVFCKSCVETDPLKSQIAVSFDENGTTKNFILEVTMNNPLKASGYQEYKRLDFNCEGGFYYYYVDQKIFLEPLLSDWLLVSFDLTATDAEIIDYINQTGLFMPANYRNILDRRYGDHKLLPVKTKERKTCAQLQEIIRTLEKSPMVVFAHLTFEPDKEVPNSDYIDSYYNTLFVQVKDVNDLSDLQTVVKMTNTRSQPYPELPGFFVINVGKNSMGDALQMASYFYETGKFEYVDFKQLTIPFDRLSPLHDEVLIEIPSSVYWNMVRYDSFYCQEIQDDFISSKVMVINSNEELENYIRSMFCDELTFPAIDFSKQTLLIADGRDRLPSATSLDPEGIYLQNFSAGYALNVPLTSSITGIRHWWYVAVVTDKLEEDTHIELIINR